MLPWKQKSYSVCSSQVRGTFGKDNGKIPKIIKNLSLEAQLALNNFVEEEAISDPSSLRFSNLSNPHIKLKKRQLCQVCSVNFREKVSTLIWVLNFWLRRYICSHFVFKNGQLILSFSTKRQIPLTRVLYALRHVKFEGSSMGRKPFLWKITSSRVADLSRLRSKAPYCKHETTNRITCNKVAAQRKTSFIFTFSLSTIESETMV